MDVEEKIVVYKIYESGIQANLAKSKLDSYGVPCTLFGEEISNLYPMLSHGFAGIYLKVFENDLQRVREILGDTEPNSFATCPNCHSSNVTLNGTASIVSKLNQTIMRLMHIEIGHHNSFVCNNCKRTFEFREM